MKKIIALFLCGLLLNAIIPLDAMAIEEVSVKQVNLEHLNLPKKVAKKSPTDIVKVSSVDLDVISYNVLPLTFAQDFTSKTAKVGDEIVFITSEDILTKEGTVVLPATSKMVATITEVKKPKSFNRSGKVYLKFSYLELANGQRIDLNAKVFSKKDFLSRGKLNALGKSTGSWFGGLAIGTAAGCGIGVAAGAVIIGGFAIGLPVGVAVGLLAGSVTPGLYYKAKAGDKINIQVLGDVVIPKQL